MSLSVFIRYSVSSHSNADGLLRLPLHGIKQMKLVLDPNIYQLESLPVTAVQSASSTRTTPILSQVFSHTQMGWPSKVSEHVLSLLPRKEELSVESGRVLWGVVIPEKHCKTLLNELHHDHPGITKMKAFACSYFWWPGLDNSIEELAKSSLECQAVKLTPKGHCCLLGFGQLDHGNMTL